MDVERILHLTAVNAPFYSFQGVMKHLHRLIHTGPWSKSQKISKDITETVLSDHITIMLEFNNKEKKSWGNQNFFSITKMLAIIDKEKKSICLKSKKHSSK